MSTERREWMELVADLREKLAATESDVDLYKSRCVCELADDDEAEHECGWQVCGVCWNNACAAHKKVADQLQAKLAAAEADLEVARDINKLEHDERLSSFKDLQDLAACRALLREVCYDGRLMGWRWITRAKALTERAQAAGGGSSDK